MEVISVEVARNVPFESARLWIRRVERRRAVEAGFHPELRTWVRRAILEAERRGDFEKKGQLLSLLKEL
jgi:hypothetical protein